MMEKIANAIVREMEKEKLLDHEMNEYYVYALVTLVERWLTIGTIICISFIYNNLFPTVLFLMFFLSLRKRTGGFHAKNFWQCYLGTVLTYVFIIVTSQQLVYYMEFIYVLLICSIIMILLIGTVNHPNMAMDCYELQESKKAARYTLGLECIILFAAIALNINKMCICYISLAIILCATLLCIAKIIKQETI